MLRLFMMLTTVQMGACVLRGVVEITRHGARTPIRTYSWQQSWDLELGELTHQGKAQHYLLGKEFHERYIKRENLLQNTFNLSEVYVRTTDYSRAVMSAQAQTMGLFPDGPNLTKPSNKLIAVPPFDVDDLENSILGLKNSALPDNFQPVPIDIYDREHDNMLLGFGKSCPKMEEIMKNAIAGEAYQKKENEYKVNLQKQLEDALKTESISFEDAAFIGDTLETMDFYGIPLPNNITVAMRDKLINIRDFYNSYVFTAEGVSLSSSAMFGEILSTFDGLINKSSTRKFSLYVAHDMTLIGFLSVLRSWDNKNPDFASVLIFELHEISDVYYVRIFYNDNALGIAGICSGDCKYDAFKGFINSWKVSDISKACSPQQTKRNTENIFQMIS